MTLMLVTCSRCGSTQSSLRKASTLSESLPTCQTTLTLASFAPVVICRRCAVECIGAAAWLSCAASKPPASLSRPLTVELAWPVCCCYNAAWLLHECGWPPVLLIAKHVLARVLLPVL